MNKEFWKAALIRAIKTFCQAAIAAIPTTAVALNEVNWALVFSAATLASILSVLTSISAGLPEVQLAQTLYDLDNDGDIEPNNYVFDDEEYEESEEE